MWKKQHKNFFRAFYLESICKPIQFRNPPVSVKIFANAERCVVFAIQDSIQIFITINQKGY